MRRAGILAIRHAKAEVLHVEAAPCSCFALALVARKTTLLV